MRKKYANEDERETESGLLQIGPGRILEGGLQFSLHKLKWAKLC